MQQQQSQVLHWVGQNYSETLNANNEVTARDYGAGTVIRQITDPEVDSVQLLFTIPRLFSTAQEGLARGQIFNGSIRIVSVQRRGSAYVRQFDRTITGTSITTIKLKHQSLSFRVIEEGMAILGT